MPTSPNVPQGNINRLKGSIVIPDFPSLNITAPFLGKEGFSASFGAPATDRIPTLTGSVPSPAPYRPVAMSVHLIKSQGLSQSWKAQEELNTILGVITFRQDVANAAPWLFDNCSLAGVQSIVVNGMDAGYVISIEGVWYINAALWG